MLSYTYKPARGTGRITPSESRTSDDTQTDRFLEAMEDDVVTLDYLIGVTPINGEYAFVQYKPTEKHKRCAGTKISPVHQINMFIQTLRDNGVSLETAICTIAESNQRTLWLRIPLSELKELSLEPLWMIRGVVQLFGKQQCIAIAIDDRALANTTLDPDTALLVDSCVREQTAQTHRDDEPSQRQQTPKGSLRSSPTETLKRKRTLASQDTDSVAVCKNPKPLCRDTPIHGKKQHRRHGVTPKFNVKNRNVHRYKTRNTTRIDASEVSLASSDMARPETPSASAADTADDPACDVNQLDEQCEVRVTQDEPSRGSCPSVHRIDLGVDVSRDPSLVSPVPCDDPVDERTQLSSHPSQGMQRRCLVM
ncbi:hypothetical protein ACER0C_003461 [Sarotherodon galilaeus]